MLLLVPFGPGAIALGNVEHDFTCRFAVPKQLEFGN
jgi:hypothetical protein